MKTAIPVRRQQFLEFLREWMDFALAHPTDTDMDAVDEHAYIEPAFGLCGNFRHFLVHRGLLRDTGHDWYTNYSGWVERQFERDGLNGFYPFGEDTYDGHMDDKTHHLVPARVEWVQNYLFKNS